MIVEVVAVGTELLLGQIVNTNAAHLGQVLAEDGFDVNHQVTVGDNLERLVDTIRSATQRADAVVLTGGIGPTQDDMTRDAIAALIGSEIVRDPEHEEMIRARLEARGVVADTALRMADYPADATPLPNSKGVALGIAAEHDSALIFAVPGVPTEMRAMIDEQVRPRLREASGDPAVLVSRQLHTWGFGESQVAEKLDDLYETTNPSVAFLINGPEVRIRITAKATSSDEASSMIAEIESVVRARLGDAVFAVDDEKVDHIVAERLASLGWTVAAIETLTAGGLSQRLAEMPSFVGGTIVVSDVDELAIDQLEPAALDLLDTSPSSADVTIACTPATGQASGDGVAARVMAIAVRTPTGTTSRRLDVLGDDERARRFAIPGALHILRTVLLDTEGES
ncbi:MAG: CinA family nicotinamide mononucleotide deamidase-related protein [Acidimicrobiales bacterium]